MAKINNPKFGRGQKLSAQHIANSNDPVQTLFTDKLDRDNIKAKKVPFYINYTFAGFAANAMGLTADEQKNGVDGNLVFPIPLIPTQDHFSIDGRLDKDTPTYLLDSISIALDLRGEGAAIQSPLSGVVAPDTRTRGFKIDYEKADQQDIKMSLLEKDYKVLASNSVYPTNSIFSTTVPATIAFAGDEVKVENPYYIPSINKQLNPYKSYYLAFHFPDQETASYFLSNLVFSFKFFSLLDTRNQFTTNTGNQPSTNDDAAIGTYNLGLANPAIGTTISADDATGLQTNLNKVDEAVQEKITTGTDKFGKLQYFDDGFADQQSVSTFNCYDVIVVPFWQGTFGNTGAMTTYGEDSGAVGSPDITAGPIFPANYTYPSGLQGYTGYVQDIRTIPLFYPFTIHHILAYHNEQIKDVDVAHPATVSYNAFGGGSVTGVITGKIGVGLGTGWQSDKYTYEEVAYHEYDNTWANEIDKVRIRNSKYSRDGGGRLMQIPLTYNSGTGSRGVGFVTQEQPVYCGGNTKRAETRTGFAQPSTAGTEQFLEIRWQYQSDGRGWYDHIHPPEEATPQVIAGFGGHFVYLIGKKTLTTNRNNLQE